MIQFLCTSPKPKISGTDALYNEINLLQQEFNGSTKSLYPFSTPSSLYPIPLFGFHNFHKIKKAESSHNIHHIFAPTILNLPFIYFLKKPIIYSIVAGISNTKILSKKSFTNRIHTFLVSNERDLETLNNNGIKNVKMIRTAIPIEHLKTHPLPLKNTLHLLLASAPWELKQFESKGIYLILRALQKTDNIHITFLWRNILPGHMKKLIQEYNVESKTTFINEKRNINDLIKNIHGCILLANDNRLVKAYPHSLIESLCCGKPVIISKEIPMADFIEKNKCGVVLNNFLTNNLTSIFSEFKNNYPSLTTNTTAIPKQAFSIKRMLDDYRMLYKENL